MNEKADQLPPSEEPADDTGDRPKGRFPLLGCLKGTVQVREGVDLTEPADPAWGAHLND